MYKLVLLILLLFNVSYTVYGQGRREGQVYFEEDTIDVTFKIPIDIHLLKPQYEKIQYKITYYNSNGKKVKLGPSDALGYSFEHEGKQMSDLFFKPAPIFLRLIKEDKVTMFKYYYDNSLDDEEVNIVSRYVIQRDDAELVMIRRNHFKKDITEYFSNCPDLIAKIINKEYGKKNMKAIVRFANSNCEE